MKKSEEMNNKDGVKKNKGTEKNVNADRIEDMLDDLAMTGSGKTPEADVKALNKAIDRRIKISAAKVVGIILLSLALIFACISPILDAIYPNPYNCKTPAVEKQSFENSNQRAEAALEEFFRAYFDLNYPYVNTELVTRIKREGFGSYIIGLCMSRPFEKKAYGPENVTINMKRGFSEINDPDEYTSNWGRFDNIDETFDTEKEREEKRKNDKKDADEKIKELDKLPDSAMIYLSVTDGNEQDILDLYNASDANENLTAYWAQISPPENKVTFPYAFFGGISLENIGYELIREGSGSVWKSVEVTNERIKEKHLANLKLMLDNCDIFMDVLPGYIQDNYHFSFDKDITEEGIRHVESMDRLRTNKYCIGGRKKDVLEYIQKRDVAALVVDDVNLSIFDR